MLQSLDGNLFNRAAFREFDDHNERTRRLVGQLGDIDPVPDPRAQIDYQIAAQSQLDLGIVTQLVRAISDLSSGRLANVDFARALLSSDAAINTDVAAFDGSVTRPVT
jgi:hypothetical protein